MNRKRGLGRERRKNEDRVSGGLAEWPIALVSKTRSGASTPFVSSNLTPAANNAAMREVDASLMAFNHTAEATWPKQPRL
jgi:hypothetical protein